MKNILVVLLLPLLLPLTRAANFEGKVTMKLTGPKGAPQEMTFSIKEGLSRIDMNAGKGGSVGIIMDAAKQEMTMLMLEQKMYMTHPIPKATAAATAEGAAGTAVEITTTKEKILGYDCVKYLVTSKDGTSEIWVTDQLGGFLGMGGGPNGGGGRGGPPAQGWEQALLGKGVFPLRVVTTGTGKETFRMEATAVQPQTLAADLFAPPADFHSMSDMTRGMGMPGGIPGLPGGMKFPGGR